MHEHQVVQALLGRKRSQPRDPLLTQQLQGRLSHFEAVGAWMLGADADLTWV